MNTDLTHNLSLAKHKEKFNVSYGAGFEAKKTTQTESREKRKEIFRVHVNRIAGEVDGVVFTCTIQVLSSTWIEFGFGHVDVTSIFVGVIQDGAESWQFDSFVRAPLLLRTRSRGT
mmetsp:Transcript_6072/g.20604  ORF Transcript_6072/g.20604 Transcript_6072/m.20604 type:complete len:116 (+) Transcript_6072:2984-3331(+)